MLVASAPVTTKGTLTLTINAAGGKMAFGYGVGGKMRTLKADLDATLLSTKKAGGFVGTVVGPYHYTPAN
jgi:alpha-N-arabinofuranosidase